MATGDKIYIADKSTLDTVKSTTDTIKSNTDIIKSTADAINSKIDNLSDDGYILVGDKSKYVVSSDNSALGTGYTNNLSITGSGILYYAVITAKPSTSSAVNNSTYFQVHVDGTLVVNSSITTGSTTSSTMTMGYISKPAILTLDTSNIIIINGIAVNRSFVPWGSTNVPYTFISIEPIRFNSSLVIRSYATQNPGVAYWYYKLD